jgi:hypothetical protein
MLVPVPVIVDVDVIVERRCKGTAVFSSPQYHVRVICIPQVWYIQEKSVNLRPKSEKYGDRTSDFP